MAADSSDESTWQRNVWSASRRGGGSQRHMQRSPSRAVLRVSSRSSRRGPTQTMTPALPQAGQNTLSPSRAMGLPSMLACSQAPVTVPPAVVRAPRVMW